LALLPAASGSGDFLLMDALHRSWRNATEVASVGVVVEALDDAARPSTCTTNSYPLLDQPQQALPSHGHYRKVVPGNVKARRERDSNPRCINRICQVAGFLVAATAINCQECRAPLPRRSVVPRIAALPRAKAMGYANGRGVSMSRDHFNDLIDRIPEEEIPCRQAVPGVPRGRPAYRAALSAPTDGRTSNGSGLRGGSRGRTTEVLSGRISFAWRKSLREFGLR